MSFIKSSFNNHPSSFPTTSTWDENCVNPWPPWPLKTGLKEKQRRRWWFIIFPFQTKLKTLGNILPLCFLTIWALLNFELWTSYKMATNNLNKIGPLKREEKVSSLDSNIHNSRKASQENTYPSPSSWCWLRKIALGLLDFRTWRDKDYWNFLEVEMEAHQSWMKMKKSAMNGRWRKWSFLCSRERDESLGKEKMKT